MQFVTLFSGADCATCALSFVSAHAALGGARIIAVDDGTVSELQAQDVRRQTGDWLEIIPARKAYEILTDKLYFDGKTDRLLQSRRVLQKLFQVDAVAEGPYFYFDSDVVFLRKIDLKALAAELDTCGAIISANPRWCAYSYGFGDFGRILRSIYRVNSGVFLQREGLNVRQEAMWILGSSSAGYLERTWVEQSTRAQIYSNYRCKVFFEDVVGEPRFGKGYEDQSHLVHFMGSLRALMKDWRLEDVLNSIHKSAAVSLAAGAARRNNIGLYYADRVKRHLFNKYGMTLPASPASLFEA